MKKIAFLLTLLLIIGVNVFSQIISNRSIWAPTNSTVIPISNGYKITAPSGWSYGGFNSSGIFYKTTGHLIKVTCTCNSSGGCYPFHGWGPDGDTYGCATSDCESCTLNTSQIINNNQETFANGGFYNINIGISPINSGDSLPGGFEALFSDTLVILGLNTFLQTIYGNNPMPDIIKINNSTFQAPTGYKLLGFNVYGRGIVMVVPNSYAVNHGGGATTGSCSCTDGNCEYHKKKIGPYGAEWCDGNCTGTCTLSGIVSGNSTAFNFIFYNF